LGEKEIYWVLSHHQSPYCGGFKNVYGIDEEAMKEILRTTDEIEVLLPPFKDKTEEIKKKWGLYKENYRWILSENTVRRPIPVELARELNLWILDPAFLGDHTSYFVLLPFVGHVRMGNPFSQGRYFFNPFKEAIVALMHFSTPHHGTEVFGYEDGKKLVEYLRSHRGGLWEAKRRLGIERLNK